MGSKPAALPTTVPSSRGRNLTRSSGAALIVATMVFAGGQLAPSAGAPLQASAPKNFVVYETPQPRVALRFDDGEGRPRSLADFEGRVVLLNIWATWCPPCVKEIPALDRLAAAVSEQDVAVVAVSIDRKGIDAVRKAFTDLGVRSLAPYVDASGEALRTVHAMGLPTSLLLDRDGRVLGRVVGPAAWDDDATAAFLKQAEAPSPDNGTDHDR